MAREIMRFLRGVLRWLIIPLLYVLLILAAITAACLVWRHIGLLTDRECPKVIAAYADWAAEKIWKDIGKLEQEGNFEPLISDMVVSLAFVVAVVPLIQAYVYRRRLRRELQGAHGLEVFKVKKEGVDDLEKMLEYYEGAEHITVFCGDFDWLQPNSVNRNPKFSKCSNRRKKKIRAMMGRMKDFVTGYASEEKVTLVSSKSKELVKNALRDGNDDSLFGNLMKRFVFGEDIGIKCSLIEKVNENYTFLYRSYSGGKKHLFNAHIFRGAKESEELVSILRHLVEFGDWKNKAGQDSNASYGSSVQGDGQS
ncbi:MAG: hypothetical protein WAV28_19490 [Sedimentisphaerales bacterium]